MICASYVADKAIVFVLHVLVRLALSDRVEVLAAVFVAEKPVGAVVKLVPLQLLGGHEGHGTCAALEVVLLDAAVALGHMAEIDLLLKEDLLAALADGQTFIAPIRLLFATQETASGLENRNYDYGEFRQGTIINSPFRRTHPLRSAPLSDLACPR